MTTRVVQRTPDLGLHIKLSPLPASAPVARACQPAIGTAGWLNPDTGAYDLTAIERTVKTVSNQYAPTLYAETATVPVGDFLAVGQVNGTLCEGEVTWQTGFAADGDAPSPALPRVVPAGRAVIVDAPLAEGSLFPRPVSPGVLTLTPTVTGSGAARTLAPITLTLTSGGEIDPCGVGCYKYVLGLFQRSPQNAWLLRRVLDLTDTGDTIEQPPGTADYAVAVVRYVNGDVAPYDYDVQVGEGLYFDVTSVGSGVMSNLVVTPSTAFSDPASLKIAFDDMTLLCLAQFSGLSAGNCGDVFGRFSYLTAVYCADGTRGNSWSSGAVLKVQCAS